MEADLHRKPSVREAIDFTDLRLLELVQRWKMLDENAGRQWSSEEMLDIARAAYWYGIYDGRHEGASIDALTRSVVDADS